MTPERESVLHSWGVPAEWDAPTIAGGAGAFFWDERGRRYLDMSSLAFCANLGHQHPRVVRAIRDQAERLCFVTAGWGAAPRARLAELLLERSGFEGGRVFFTLSGADANEHAVKFARLASGRPRGWVVARDRSYHGASYAAMALSGDSRTRGQVDARGAEGAAAVLVEPNAGTNGIVAPDDYWPLLREETRRRGVLLIADEVMSGFGRCGEWFAWQRHGEAGRPDIMTLAKGLTYCGHPLACAAGVLERLLTELSWP